MTVASISIGANPSTTVLLVALGVAPVVVVVFLVDGASSTPSVAQILHTERTKDDRP
jgi:hypothetical protein